ncbi:MAG: DinB family protein [Thermomicrobiales bacterium]
MDILERLLRYDAWTTEQYLALSADLTDDQLDRHFDLGPGTLRQTWLHLIGNIETWTALMRGRAQWPSAPPAVPPAMAALQARFAASAPDFAALARELAAANRLDELWTDVLDTPPQRKSYGGAIAHVLIHNAQHRSEIGHMLQRLGVSAVPEGDVLGWEAALRAGRA